MSSHIKDTSKKGKGESTTKPIPHNETYYTEGIKEPVQKVRVSNDGKNVKTYVDKVDVGDKIPRVRQSKKRN